MAQTDKTKLADATFIGGEISEPKKGIIRRSLAATGRDPVALVAIAIVCIELFTRISIDMILSVVLIGIIIFYSGIKGSK